MTTKANDETNLKEVNARSRVWLFTIFSRADEPDKPTVERVQVEEAFREISPDCDYVFQLESGDKEHRLHYQAALCLPRNIYPRRKDVIRIMKAHDIPDAHVRASIRKEAATYCSKTHTRVSGPWFSSEKFQHEVEAMTVDKRGKRTDLTAIREGIANGQTVDELLLSGVITNDTQARMAERLFTAINTDKWATIERDVKVHYMCGETGTGKTRWIYQHYTPSQIFVAGLGGRDPFYGYSYQRVLVLDEFRGQIPLPQMLRLLDRYPYQIDRRYHDAWAAWNTVYIVSNWSLAMQYEYAPEVDRAAFMRRITDEMDFPMRPAPSGKRDLFAHGKILMQPTTKEYGNEAEWSD